MRNSSFAKNLIKGINKRFKSITKNPYKKVNLNWLNLKYYKHLPAGKLRSHQLFGKPLYFYSAPELLHALKEIFIDEIYKQHLSDKAYVIDCGANIGLSIIYIKHLFPNAEIIAFEPDEKNFEVLSKNIESFGYKDVILRKEAVWKENTILEFSNEGSMSSKIETGGGTNTTKVAAARLKDFLNRKINFLKIDIEGAEFDVINDLKDNLHFVENLFIEYHGSFEQNHELSSLLTLVTEHDFNYYIKEATPVYETPFYRNNSLKNPFDVQLNIFCFKAKK
jgi:FkbM family methyltransferase